MLSLVFQQRAYHPQLEQADLPEREPQRLVQPALLPLQEQHPEQEPQALQQRVLRPQVHHRNLDLWASLELAQQASQAQVLLLSELLLSELLPLVQHQPLASLLQPERLSEPLPELPASFLPLEQGQHLHSGWQASLEQLALSASAPAAIHRSRP